MQKFLLLFTFSLIFFPSFCQDLKGYFPYWVSIEKFREIETDQLTHLIYAFAQPNSDGSATILGSPLFSQISQELDRSETKLVLSIGGWGLSDGFHSIVQSQSSISKFASWCKNSVHSYNLQGIDIDWEFPNSSNKHLFPSLLQIIRDSLNTLPNGAQIELSAAVGGEVGHLAHIDPLVFPILDYLHVMAYDGNESQYGHHASLDFFQDAFNLYKDAGCSSNKIIMGVPFYGRCSPYDSYLNISNPNPSLAFVSDYFNGYCYNGKPTLELKVNYCNEKNAAGLLIWEITQDRTDQYSLLGALRNSIDSIYEQNSSKHLEIEDLNLTYGDNPTPIQFNSDTTGVIQLTVVDNSIGRINPMNEFEILSAGETAIMMTQSSHSDTIFANVIVRKAPLNLLIGKYKKDYGNPNPAFHVNSNGWKLSDGSHLFSNLKYITNAQQNSDVGIYPITIELDPLQNYSPIIQDGEIEVLPIDCQINYTGPLAPNEGDLVEVKINSNSTGNWGFSIQSMSGTAIAIPNLGFLCARRGLVYLNIWQNGDQNHNSCSVQIPIDIQKLLFFKTSSGISNPIPYQLYDFNGRIIEIGSENNLYTLTNKKWNIPGILVFEYQGKKVSFVTNK